MTRVGTARPGVPAIVGLWTYKWSEKSGTMATMQYTSGGLSQFSLPMQTFKGRYKLQADELTMEFEGKPPAKRKIKFNGFERCERYILVSCNIRQSGGG